MPLKDMNCQEGCMTLHIALHRLTVLRDALSDPPLQSLDRLLSLLLHGDAFAAAEEYHALTTALLTGGYRRVSGDLFRDSLYWLLLERENAFSIRAARGKWDEPLASGMRADMQRLNPLFQLNSVLFKRWIGERYRDQRQKPRQQKDNISVLSTAIWGGNTSRPLPSAHPAPAAPPPPPQEPMPQALDENELLSWRYQPDEHMESYAADSALEELYRRFDSAEDRAVLLDDLWNYHASCGTGTFVRDRLFTLGADGGLLGLPMDMLPEEDSYTFYVGQREQALHNAIRFMRGDRADNMLITGGPGAGKTTQVFSLARELPELRLISCPPGRMRELAGVLPALSRQPLKFLLFLDEFDPADPAWPQLRAALSPGGAQPRNLLLAAAARKAEEAFFPLRIHLPPPQLKEFIELVQIMLVREGRDVDFDSIQNACIDYAAAAGVNGGSPLSFRSAGLIAEGLLSGE
jgi:hypothetical protein